MTISGVSTCTQAGTEKYEKSQTGIGRRKRTLMQYDRLLLRQVMKEAGFHPLPSEWWHFNRVSRQTAKERKEDKR